MSSLHNRITTTFTASGGQAIAVMGQISSGMMNIGRSSDRMGQQVGNVERQFRALGTTIRYALAGTAVFAIPNAIRQLAEVQQQLGLMSAIGTEPSGIPIIGAQLRQLGNDAQAGAVNAITPVQEFNDAIVNFLSTVQGVPSNQVADIVTEIARAAKLSQTPVEDATKAFTTMSVAFGRPLNARNAKQEVQRTAQEFFMLTQMAPGGVQAGPQIIQQLGQLAQVTRLGGGTRPQLFGLLLSGLRSGIPPSQLARGLQFMIQTIGLPGQQTKESEQALGSVGIRAGQRMPLLERISRIFTHARRLSFGGDLGRVSRLDEETLSTFDEQGGTPAMLKGLGITGPGAVFLGKIFHRVHALRTALALLGQFDIGQYQKDVQAMEQAERGHVQDIHNLNQAWDRFRKQSRLKEAGVALSTLQLQIAQAFAPILNPVAGGLTSVARSAQHHRDATRITALTVGGLLAAGGLGRMVGFRIPGLGGLSRLGRAAPAGMAIESALTGQIPKGTPTDPLFVIVMSDIFGGRGKIQYPSPIGPGRGPASGGGRRLPFGLPFGATALALGATADVTALLATPNAGGSRSQNENYIKRHYPSLYAMGVRRVNQAGGFMFAPGLSSGTRKALSDLHRDHSIGEVNRILRDRMTRIYTNMGGSAKASASEIAMAVLKGTAELEIIYNQPDGTKARKKVHVRTDNWSGGNTPQHRGRNRGNRR